VLPARFGSAGAPPLGVVTLGLRPARAAGVLVTCLCLALTGCSSDEAPSPTVAVTPLSASERQALTEWVVDGSSLSRLRRTTRVLTREDVVAAAYLPDLEETLSATGFRGGVVHEYRGRSRQLTGVESQVLAFSSRDGATDFSAYLSEHADGFFGEPTEVVPLTLGGHAGWLFEPPVCDCAGAYPISAGALQVDDKVLVLQITGPEANARQLRGLLRGTGT
jgi:hypothetical protein